ncbi:MAG: serine/threonine protein kinase [Elainellaceae cyanobacterium]
MEQLISQIIHHRYQVQSLLGRQVGRRTFLATDLETQQAVVLKLLLFGPDFSWDHLKLFEREAETLKSLDHPSIPKYLDSFDIQTDLGQGFALVQSYIEAPSLEGVIQSGRTFSEADVIEIANQILEILIYLHGQLPPIIHRDIKPSNILLANRSGHSVGDLFLVDFGSVQTIANKKSGTITIVGSYGYIPLEQFAGQTTTASDLYSLGMTLVYLITGIHPADLTQANGQVTFKCDQMSRRFSRWLERMTHPHLDRRFSSAESALKVLRSEEESYGYYPNLKPAGSQVELYRDGDRIEIVAQQSPPVSTHLGCGIPILCFIILIGLSMGLFTGTFLLLLISIIILVFYIHRVGELKEGICIERNAKISDICSSKSARWERQSSPFQDINLLVYNPGYTFDRYIDNKGRTIAGGKVNVPPKLSIYAGSVEYLVGHERLSQAELWWLGQELSDFLDLELKIIYPTPNVPPEQTCGCGC